MASVPSDLVTVAEAYEALKDEIPRLTQAMIQGWVNRGQVQKYKRATGRQTFVSLAEIREKATIRPVDNTTT
jgi:hypothetical protein